MSVIKKIVVKQQDKPDSPVRWVTIGIYINKEGKEYLKLNMLPLGNWDGFAHVFEDNDKEGQDAKPQKGKTRNAAPQQHDDGPGEEAPF